MRKPSTNSDRDRLDPVYRHSLRECWLILLTWGLCLLWTIGYSWQQGYRVPGGPLQLVLGMPRWVFWGVLLPWILATAFSIAFGLFGVVDEPLGEDKPEPEDSSAG